MFIISRMFFKRNERGFKYIDARNFISSAYVTLGNEILVSQILIHV
jgi:hypothetical protein